MKKSYRGLLVCATFIFFLSNVKAQDSTKNAEPVKSHFEAGLSYLNNNVYLGRHDSLKIPYLNPSFYYHNRSGFFAGSSVSYIIGTADNHLDLVEIEAGYEFTKKKLAGVLSAEKDFYNSESNNVKAETKGSVNATLSYDFGFIKPLLQGGIAFNTTNDYYAAFGVGHSFLFDDDNIEINPSFLINASTQNSLSAYYTKRKFKPKRKNQTGGPTETNGYLPNASQFKIMDYEFSLPVDYSAGNFTFEVIPTLSLPVNPDIVVVTVTPPSGNSISRTNTENLNNVFFWSAGVTYTF